MLYNEVCPFVVCPKIAYNAPIWGIFNFAIISPPEQLFGKLNPNAHKNILGPTTTNSHLWYVIFFQFSINLFDMVM